jgi:hypothetical protein
VNIPFLIAVDVFSLQIFGRILESKSPKHVKTAFESIFEEAGGKPNKLESDAGVEYTALKNWFKEQEIYFKLKYGLNNVMY